MMNEENSDIREKELIKRVSRGEKEAFEQIFFEHYYSLCRAAVKITKCSDLARDAVQDVFFKLWNNRAQWNVHLSLRAYLMRAVRNQALNLTDRKEKYTQLNQASDDSIDDEGTLEVTIINDPAASQLSKKLVERIWEIVEQMPVQRKRVFELHKKDALSYQEISKVMNIARKTVENHMGRALQELRENLDKETLVGKE